MKKWFLLPIAFLISGIAQGQELKGSELLDKAIQYHDPENNWGQFRAKLSITMQTPTSSDRLSEIWLDFPREYFRLSQKKDDTTVLWILDKDECSLTLNGSSDISKEDVEKYRLNCKRAATMKNYYSFLYGLPMKLKNPGTLVDPKVQSRTFKGKEYLVLKVNYEESIGKDVWYFYFDPETYAMEMYQFYHDESKNDGEYILLSESLEVSAIKMPRIRAWYYNKNDEYLGTDILNKASILK